jgi:hypothetical protein
LKKDLVERMNEISEKIEVFATCLQTRIDPRAVSRNSLMPFKVLVRREALAWRFVDLCRGAVMAYREEYLASAATLTRAAFETTAALWHLHAKVESVVETGTIGDMETYLKRLLLGNRTVANTREAINVITFVEKMDKKYKGTLRQYNELSEFAHPNWAGTLGLCHEIDKDSGWVNFSKAVCVSRNVGGICAVNLDVAQMIFEGCYAQIPDMMPRFQEICERDTAKDASQ